MMFTPETIAKIAAGLTGLATLIFFNKAVAEKEALLTSGRETLFDLAPRDPRSLMQGDYMVLRYRLAQDLEDKKIPNLPRKGLFALTVKNRVAENARVVSSAADLRTGEVLLQFKTVEEQIQIGSESFFFQEGDAHIYETARYADLRIDEKGKALLIGLRDKDKKPLGRTALD